MNEAHQKICKAIFKSDKVEKTVLDVLTISNPDEVVAAAANIVNVESKELCKRNSGSLLQKKDHVSLMSFTWDKFHKELEIRAPNLLKVVSAIVSDIPVAPAERNSCTFYTQLQLGSMIVVRKCLGYIIALHFCLSMGDILRGYPTTSQNWSVCQPWVCT